MTTKLYIGNLLITLTKILNKQGKDDWTHKCGCYSSSPTFNTFASSTYCSTRSRDGPELLATSIGGLAKLCKIVSLISAAYYHSYGPDYLDLQPLQNLLQIFETLRRELDGLTEMPPARATYGSDYLDLQPVQNLLRIFETLHRESDGLTEMPPARAPIDTSYFEKAVMSLNPGSNNSRPNKCNLTVSHDTVVETIREGLDYLWNVSHKLSRSPIATPAGLKLYHEIRLKSSKTDLILTYLVAIFNILDNLYSRGSALLDEIIYYYLNICVDLLTLKQLEAETRKRRDIITWKPAHYV